MTKNPKHLTEQDIDTLQDLVFYWIERAQRAEGALYRLVHDRTQAAIDDAMTVLEDALP